MQDFSVEGVQKMLGGTIFRGWNEILLLGKALKFGVIFQKFACKLIKLCKIIGKNRENANLSENFLIFWPGIIFNYRKNNELIKMGYSWRL